MTTPTCVLLVDDHPVVRAGCRRILAERDGLDVIEAESGAAALRLCAERRPTFIVLDLNLPDLNGLDVLRQVLERCPGVRVLVFSMYEDPAFVAHALEAGALGYITKSDDPAILLEALDRIALGGIFLGRSVAQKVALAKLQPAADPLLNFTPRERDVVGLLAAGKSLTEIAHELSISYRTTAGIAANLRARLGLPTMVALVKFAVENARA